MLKSYIFADEDNVHTHKPNKKEEAWKLTTLIISMKKRHKKLTNIFLNDIIKQMKSYINIIWATNS